MTVSIPHTRRRPRSAASNGLEIRLDRHVFYHFTRILAKRNRNLNAELSRHGIDYPRWRVLAVLSQHRGCSMLQLAEHTSVDRTTLAHTVGMLVTEGLVARVARKSDRRSVELSLTPRGERVLRTILPAVFAENDAALAGFTDAETAEFLAMLKRVLGNLE